MFPRWLGVLGFLFSLTACATSPTPGPPPGDPFVVAQDQALALGKVLAGIRLCEGVAWELPFYEFMDVKRQRGLTETEASMIAAMTGAGEAQAEPEMLACSAEAAARRAAAITELRAQW